MIASAKALIFTTLCALGPRMGFNAGATMAESETLHPDIYRNFSDEQADAVLNALTGDITVNGDITEQVNQIISTSLQSGSIKAAINGVFEALASTAVTSINVVDLDAIPATFADLGAARSAVNDLRTDVNADLQALEAKYNALISSLNSVGLVAGT